MTSSELPRTLLEAGEIVASHGIHGEVKILSWADGPEFLLDFEELFIDGRAYAVEAARVHKTCVLAKLRGIDTPEAVLPLRGRKVCIDRSRAQLPEGRVFIADLLGCRVLDETRGELGTVVDVLCLPASEVYVVKGEKCYLIPSVKQFVKEIDIAARTVRVSVIEGMETDAY